jgi:Mycothiol maleylpyruvate isomerase N-terminal domain
MSRMTELSHDPRHTYAEAAEAFVELVRAIPTDAWHGPGLGEWDLRSLVGHTSRSLITVETYLGQPADREEAASPAAYYAAISTVDPAAVAGRGREAGRALGDDPVATIQALVPRVLALVEGAGNPLITTAAGGMRLRTYLPTRTLELVVHGLDIAAAAGLAVPLYGDAVLSEVAEVAAGAAVLQGRGMELIRALTGRAGLPDGFSVV